MEYLAFKGLADLHCDGLCSPVFPLHWERVGDTWRAEADDGDVGWGRGIHAGLWDEAATYAHTVFLVVPFWTNDADTDVMVAEAGWRAQRATALRGPYLSYGSDVGFFGDPWDMPEEAAQCILSAWNEGYRQIPAIVVEAAVTLGGAALDEVRARPELARLEPFLPVHLNAEELATLMARAVRARFGPEEMIPLGGPQAVGDGLWDMLSRRLAARMPLRTLREAAQLVKGDDPRAACCLIAAAGRSIRPYAHDELTELLALAQEGIELLPPKDVGLWGHEAWFVRDVVALAARQIADSGTLSEARALDELLKDRPVMHRNVRDLVGEPHLVKPAGTTAGARLS